MSANLILVVCLGVLGCEAVWLRRRHRERALSFTIAVTALAVGAGLAAVTMSGWVIVAPALGALLMQGQGSAVVVALALGGVIAAATHILISAARQAWVRERRGAVWGGALLCWILTCAGFRWLNPGVEAGPALRVYYLDLYFPALLAWIVVCAAGALPAWRRSAGLAGMAVLCWWRWPSFSIGDPMSALLWRLLVVGTVVGGWVAVATAPWRKLEPVRGRGWMRYGVLAPLAGVSAAVVFEHLVPQPWAALPADVPAWLGRARAAWGDVVFWPRTHHLPLSATVTGAVIFALALAGLVAVGARRAPPPARRGPVVPHWRAPLTAAAGCAVAYAALHALSATAAYDPALRLSGWVLGPEVAPQLAIAAAAAVVATALDACHGGTMFAACRSGLHRSGQASWRGAHRAGRGLWHRLGRRMGHRLISGGAAGHPAVETAAALPAGGENADAGKPLQVHLRWSLGVLLKAAAGVVVLAALIEIPDAGKTLIMPFSVAASGVDAASGQTLALTTSNLILFMRDQIVPLGQGSSRKSGNAFSAGASGAAAAQNLQVKVPGTGFDLPMQLLLLPLEAPLRRLMGIHVIQGTIFPVADGGLSALAVGDDGQAWQATSPKKEAPQERLYDLADQLAVKIAGSDPAFAGLGIGNSPPAFDDFQQALTQWEAWTSHGDPDDLQGCIRLLRQAVQVDPAFALAQYRLGVALENDNQPEHAAGAFRNAIAGDSRFAPAYIALGELLTYFPSYYYGAYPADVAYPNWETSAAWQTPEQLQRETEGRQMLRDVLQPGAMPASRLQQATVDYDLCQAGESPWVEAFYCLKSLQTFGDMPRVERDSAAIRSDEASTLGLYGQVLGADSYYPTGAERKLNWNCDSGVVDPKAQNGEVEWKYAPDRNLATELAYYRAAHAIDPANAGAACRAALEQAIAGSPQPLQDFEAMPDNQKAFGEGYDPIARTEPNGATYNDMELAAFTQAMGARPSDMAILNDFAGAVWEGRLFPQGQGALLTQEDLDGELQAAQRAADVAAETASPMDLANAQDTLVEALLAVGRYRDAVAEFGDINVSQNHLLDEVRWDGALAYSCLAQGASSGGDRQRDEQSAQSLLEQVYNHQKGREVPMLVTAPPAADAGTSLCARTLHPLNPEASLAEWEPRLLSPDADARWPEYASAPRAVTGKVMAARATVFQGRPYELVQLSDAGSGAVGVFYLSRFAAGADSRCATLGATITLTGDAFQYNPAGRNPGRSGAMGAPELPGASGSRGGPVAALGHPPVNMFYYSGDASQCSRPAALGGQAGGEQAGPAQRQVQGGKGAGERQQGPVAGGLAH